MAGRVFIVVRYSPDVIIGKRGFSDQEKKQGLVLVFNSSMKFQWDDFGITATLAFGTAPQKCFIPVDAIVAVYSPELNMQFIAAPQAAGTKDNTLQTPARAETPDADAKVVKVDFTKKGRQ